MGITLEQAKVFEAVARLGTVQSAAEELHKTHSAVLYSLKALEEQTGIVLFDRTQYRNSVTTEGHIVLKYCRQMLGTRQDLLEICHKIKKGWEPTLKLVYDEVVDFNRIGNALFELQQQKTPTEIKILSTHLNEVEELFFQEEADVMVTILPLKKLQIPSTKLKPIRMLLVAHAQHTLALTGKRTLSAVDLNKHTYIKIKTSTESIGLGTDRMEFASTFYVNAFATKKAAILKQLGFGWLPDYLIQEELENKTLRILKTDIENIHVLHPHLYHRSEELLGNTTKELLKLLKQ